MFQNLRNFSQLSNTAKLTIAAVTGGGVVALATFLASKYFLLFLGGTAGVLVLIFCLIRLVKFFSKMKSVPMLQGLLQNTSSTPKGITDAGKMAQLDDLRKKFEEGLSTFKKAGKSLYEFPWFLIVGEPGSGKTEAIRHCNIGFPPGLQDEFQGAGGTLNMNWWFTDHAVILDTAGRLMFEEVAAGQTSEWKEFLSLMKKFRYNCPINGLFLAIPADSLIKDSADEIEKKASQIARQLDVIQRTLDVRFPVFVIITKSDLITGFRDFFLSVDDPQLQHQMFGWSNPAPLDEPFNSTFIDQHIKMVKGRLFRRRLALLYRTTIEENTSLSSCQKESMFAFPYTLEKLAPRMSLYLERIFSIGNQWSCKPLFFRGIYFTSSMQEGSALDQELAETLGVPVESLPDGRIWAREKAYFLRDLFMKKVFVEKGLVSRATNASRQHTRRKAVVLATLIISVLCMISFTLYGVRHYRMNIDKLDDFSDIKEESHISYLRLIDDNGKYVGDKNYFDANLSKKSRVYGLLEATGEWNEKCKHLWRPLQVVNKDELNVAARNIYSYSLVNPLILVACTRLNEDTGGQNLQDNQNEEPGGSAHRLNTLLNIYSSGTIDKTKLSELAGYTLSVKDVNHIRGVGEEKGAEMNLLELCPSDIPVEGKLRARIAPDINAGLDRFFKYWSDPNQYAKINVLDGLVNKLTEYDKIEKELLKSGDFQIHFESLSGKSEEIKNYIEQNGIKTLSTECDNVRQQALASIDTAFLAITLSAEDWNTLKKDVPNAQKFETAKEDILKKMEIYFTAKKRNCGRLDNLFLEINDKQTQNLLQTRYIVWNSINQMISMTNSPDTRFLDVILESTWPEEIAGLKGDEDGRKYESHGGRMAAVRKLFISRAFTLIESKSPKNAGDLEDGIKEYSLLKNQQEQQKPDDRQAGQESLKYDIATYGNFKQNWEKVCAIFENQTVETKWSDLQKFINTSIGNYESRYLEYWKGSFPRSMVKNLLDEQIQNALNEMPEDIRWEQHVKVLDKLVIESAIEQLTLIKDKSISAVKKYNSINRSSSVNSTDDECTPNNKMESMINKWAELSKLSDIDARSRLTGLRSGDWIGYYDYKKDSFPDNIWGLYIYGLANETLEALNNTSRYAARGNIKQYRQIADKYPLNIASMADITEDEISILNALLTNIPNSISVSVTNEQASAVDTRPIQSHEQLLKNTLKELEKSFQDKYAKLNKTWEFWCQDELREIKIKYDKIPNQCEVWLTKVAPPKNPVYKYIQIEGLTGDEWLFPDTDQLLGRYRFPWNDVRIVCKKTADSTAQDNPVVIESPGKWSFMRMCNIEKIENIKQEYPIVSPPIGDSGERVGLIIKFSVTAQ